VAVVLTYLQALRDQRPVPAASDLDRRWQLLRHGPEAPIPCVGQVEDAYEQDREGAARRGHRRQPAEVPAPEPEGGPEPLRAFLESKPPAELVNLLLAVAQRQPRFARDLRRQQTLETGQTEDLIKRARKEIRKRTSERAWQNEWSGEGHLPDFSHLQRLFEVLLQRGQADSLLKLGRELLQAGNHQVEEAQDQGETAEALADCLRVVFRAARHSSLSNQKKILYAIDTGDADNFDLSQGADEVLNAAWSAADWSAVADELSRRLQVKKKPEGPETMRGYSRDVLVDRLIQALELAGRAEEVLPLCEAEAPLTGNYGRLVRRLIEAGRLDDAERMAQEGLEKTPAAWPGAAPPLRDLLREIAEKRSDWPLVAAYRAEDFFDHPGIDSLKALLQAAARAGRESQVREAALRYLDTGSRPAGSDPAAAPSPAPLGPPAKGRGKKAPAAKAGKSSPQAAGLAPTPAQAGGTWPLPPLPPFVSRAGTPGPAGAPSEPRPRPEVLLQLAIAENRPEDVLALYDRLSAGKNRSPWEGYAHGCRPEEVADAMATTHPDRALAIYQQQVDDLLAGKNPGTYYTAASYLKKMRSILTQHGRAGEWAPLLARVREQHRRKRKFMEILDRLDSRPIIES